MKKNLFIGLFVMIAICNSAKAQYGYLRVAGGYSWNNFQKTGQVLTFQPGISPDPAYSKIIPLMNTNTSDSNNLYMKPVNNGYATGGTLSLFGGYMINPYFGIEMGLTYLWGSTFTADAKSDDNALLGKGAMLSTRTNSSGLSLMPGFYLRAARPSAKVAPYGRFALSLPVYGQTNHSLVINANSPILGITEAKIDVKTQSTISLGVNGGIGINYTPIPILSVFGEMNAQYLFVRPQVSKLTKYDLTTNGVKTDALAGFTTYSLETEFVDQLTKSSNTEVFGKVHSPGITPDPGVSYVDENKPRQELRQSANFCAIGFSVGVGLNLSKMIFKDPTGNKKKNSTSE